MGVPEKQSNQAREGMETGDTGRSGSLSGASPGYGVTATDFVRQVTPVGCQLLEPRDHHLVTTAEVELRPLFLSRGRTYSVFTMSSST